VTFRQLGASIFTYAPEFLKHPAMVALETTGTPMTRRFAVAPHLYMCVSSVFAYVKPPTTWSKDEQAAYDVHRLSVTKQATDGSSGPRDLRINPEANQARIASSVVDSDDGTVDVGENLQAGLNLLRNLNNAGMGGSLARHGFSMPGARRPGDTRGFGFN